jgi:hypothetical protein
LQLSEDRTGRETELTLKEMKVSIVIPCYNEKATIEKIVETVRGAAIGSTEIIVVDDCSHDGTRAVLEEKVSQMVDRIIYHQVNRAKGAALRPPLVISSSCRMRTLSTAPKIIRSSWSLSSQTKRTSFSGPGSWAADRIAFSFSGIWSETIVDPSFQHVHES